MLHQIDRNVPRKEREKLYKRREILLAALKVFAEKGYEHANIEEIAIEAEFSKGALYNYFSHKEEIFIALLDEGFADFERIVQEGFENNLPLREKFQRFTDGALEYFEQNPDYLTLLFKENLQLKIKLISSFRERFAQKRQKLVEIMMAPLQEGIKRGAVRNIDAAQLVEVFWNIIFAFLLHSRCGENKASIAEDVEIILTIFFDGIELKSH
ncbi:MAG: TetR/AcrR family transcriptional regulator [bacterium]